MAKVHKMPTIEYETAEQKYEFISTQHGGYWRHDFVDHAYLYNLYFPPEAFFDHLKDNIHNLVLSYPVAQNVLAGLVGDLIGQPPERIVVGNGAAELIKIVSGRVARRLIVPTPSFNEYVNAADPAQVVEFVLEPPSFQLDVDKFAAEAARSKADVAVVVSPNNPTSLIVPKALLKRLADALAAHDCTLIVDESFIDFSSDARSASLEGEIDEHPNLVIFKSMSKAYGICGLRIGYLLSANTPFAEAVRKEVHIWNLNGFAEEFLRLAPQYRHAFEESCRKVRADCLDFYRILKSVKGMTVFKPDANYVFCRLPDDAPTGPEVARRLFIEHNIFIKDCQGKTMPESDRYIRIASRTQEENQRLVIALREVITSPGEEQD
jgi:histidinol-phosphate/aromatic aminotransferase/cobyric acid decarboxylase-like protein